MVTLPQIISSNARVGSALPPGMVAVFVGGTSGIGEYALKQFARYSSKPRVYFVGRAEEAGKRIASECQALNAEGTFTFIKADVSLIRNVDKVCDDIKAKESSVNLLFQTQGNFMQQKRTEEGLHSIVALPLHSRFRFMENLLPQMQAASGLRRVVSVCVATKEGPFLDDMEAWDGGMMAGRAHLASLITFSLESLAARAPDVSFVHNFPGMVRGNVSRDREGLLWGALRLIGKAARPFLAIPDVESGNFHTFLATSAAFPPAKGDAAGVPVADGVQPIVGSDGKVGSGVYTVDEHADLPPSKTMELLVKMRGEGAVSKVRTFLDEQYKMAAEKTIKA